MGFISRAHAHLVIHFMAHSALRAMQGMVLMAWNRCCFSAVSLMYVSSSRLYISARKLTKQMCLINGHQGAFEFSSASGGQRCSGSAGEPQRIPE